MVFRYKNLLAIIAFYLFLSFSVIYLSSSDLIIYSPLFLFRLIGEYTGIGLCVYYWGVLCSLFFRKDGYVRIWMIVFPLFIILGFGLLCANWISAGFSFSLSSLFDLYTLWKKTGYINYCQYTLYSLLLSFLIAFMLRKWGKYVTNFIIISINVVTIFVVSCPISDYNCSDVGYTYEIIQAKLFFRSSVDEGILKVEISKTPTFDNSLILIERDNYNWFDINLYEDGYFYYSRLDEEHLVSLGDFVLLDSNSSKRPVYSIEICDNKRVYIYGSEPYRTKVRVKQIDY